MSLRAMVDVMTKHLSISTPRLAGLLYLIPMFFGPFSMMVVPSAIMAPGDAAATTSRLVSNESLFRLGMLSDAVIFLTEVALSAVLYAMLKPAGRTLALAATFARLAMAVVQAVNLFPELAALEVIHRTAFSAADTEALVLSMLDLHAAGAHVWEAFFGLHCLLAGVLVYRSGAFPRVLGPLLIVAALGYALDGLGSLVSSRAENIFGTVVTVTALVGEIPFVLWLVCHPRAEVGLRTARIAPPRPSA